MVVKLVYPQAAQLGIDFEENQELCIDVKDTFLRGQNEREKTINTQQDPNPRTLAQAHLNFIAARLETISLTLGFAIQIC